jgi:hypothetical protein
MRWAGSGNEQNAIEMMRANRLARNAQMSLMNGVERAAE